MPLLDVEKLTIRFGGLTAVDKVDLAIEPGQIYSVIGPNGAGKTTVFNAITGIYEPTSGEVRFAGKRLERPFTWLVVLACVLVGLATGISVALFMGNVDKLWRAGIRRNLYEPERPFTIGNAIQSGLAYLAGEIAVERQRDGTFSVMNADGSLTLANVPTRAEAEPLRDGFADLVVDLEQGNAPPESRLRDGVEKENAVVELLSPDGKQTLARFRSREAALARIARLAKIPAERAAFTTMLWTSFLGGLVLGTAGAFVIWSRSRRTPDVIAHGGLARTFQNIRLFQNMTVVENVLVGMDRKFSRNPLGILFPLPTAKAKDRELLKRACELLDFVGLGGQRQNLAKNLPYGDQRRLEIARALATEPKLILLDEPAAGMNPSESDDLMHLVHKIRGQGITVVLIEHHMKLVMNISDRIAVLNQGQRIAEGTPTDVKSNPAVIEAYLGKEEVS